MIICKECDGAHVVKNGLIGNKQRYKCKDCGCNFREGDGRTDVHIQAKKAFCTLFYAMAQGSYRLLGRVLHMSHSQIYRWMHMYGEKNSPPDVVGTATETNISSLQQGLASTDSPFDPDKPVFVVQGRPWNGYTMLIVLQDTREERAEKK